MVFAYLDQGAPVEVFAGMEFTTPQLIVASDETETYPVGDGFAQPGDVIDWPQQHASNFLALCGPDDLARYLIQSFIDLGPAPDGKILQARTLVVNDGVISAHGTYIDAPAASIPQSVSRFQFKSALLVATKLSAAQTGVANSGDDGLILWWGDRDDFRRNDAELLKLATMLSLQASEIDGLFVAAAQIG